MIPHGRYIFAITMLLITAYIAKRVHMYHFNTTPPVLTITGLDEDAGYAGDISGTLIGTSPYKIAHLSMWLDDAIMHKDLKINRSKFNHPINLAQKNIVDGAHNIKFEVTEATKNRNKTTIQRNFYTDNADLQATLIPLSSGYRVPQGRCLYIQLQTNKQIKFAQAQVFENSYNFYPERKNSTLYEVMIPIECEQDPGSYPFTVQVTDRLGNSMTLSNTFHVTPVNFKKRILNVAGNKLQSELEFTNLQEQDLEQQLEQLSKRSPQEKMWSGLFDVPLVMKGITTDFGVIRTSQERGRKVHKALDLIADPKSVIWASANGVIVLKDRFTHSGNTVVIDHGCGVLSMYYHLHDFTDIAVGQKVKKGHPLGRMGMTGYASGDHLHWEIRVNNIAVEPMQWTQKLG